MCEQPRTRAQRAQDEVRQQISNESLLKEVDSLLQDRRDEKADSLAIPFAKLHDHLGCDFRDEIALVAIAVREFASALTEFGLIDRIEPCLDYLPAESKAVASVLFAAIDGGNVEGSLLEAFALSEIGLRPGLEELWKAIGGNDFCLSLRGVESRSSRLKTDIAKSKKPAISPKSKAKPRNWWKNVLLPLLETLADKERYTTVRDLARRFECSNAPVQKCFANSEKLKAWMDRKAITVKATTSQVPASGRKMMSQTEIDEAIVAIEHSVPESERSALREQMGHMDAEKMAEVLAVYANKED